MVDHKHAKARRFLDIQPGSETDAKRMTSRDLKRVLARLVRPRTPEPRRSGTEKIIRGPGPAHR